MSADATLTDDAIVRGEAPEQDKAATDAARQVGTAVEKSDFTLPARHSFDSSQTAVIRNTVAKDCNVNELAMFLEVAARYRLDPFTREIFAAKFNGDNGPVTIFAGRDGMLKAAKNSGKFRKMESAVVREKDEYEVTVDTMGTIDGDTGGRVRALRHVRKGMGEDQRGKIVGAYALVWLHGEEEPWFAEATWEDYGKAKSGASKSNWKLDGTGYPEAMMVKVPQAIALRMACGLTGLYAQEEVQKQLDAKHVQNLSGGHEATERTPGVEYPDSELGSTLEALVNRANELTPGTWRAAKVAFRVNGKTTEEHEALAAELRRFIFQRDPKDPLATAETITDAEVVTEPEAKADEPVPTPQDPEAAPPMQGPVSDSILSAMHDNEDARELVQERYEQLSNAETGAEMGFENDDALMVELDRLQEALREATNGGETVAEAATREEVVDGVVVDDDEPPVTWEGELSEAEVADLEDVLPTLRDEVEKAANDTDRAVLQRNLAEAEGRLNALYTARDAVADEPADADTDEGGE